MRMQCVRISVHVIRTRERERERDQLIDRTWSDSCDDGVCVLILERVDGCLHGRLHLIQVDNVPIIFV